MHTGHSVIRMKQRGIPPIVVDLLMQFGTSEKSFDGTRKLYFDKRAKRRVHAYVGSLAGLIDEHLNVYAVVTAEDAVVTAGHRLERIRHH